MRYDRKIFVKKFGMFIIFVMVINIYGCVPVYVPNRTSGSVMSDYDLSRLRVNCEMAAEQIRFLHSMRRHGTDRVMGTVGRIAGTYQGHVPTKNTNWLINQKILQIYHDC